MGPPTCSPPKNEETSTMKNKVPMDPPPVPKFPIQEEETNTTLTNEEESKPILVDDLPGGITLPYTIPPWSEPPCHPYSLEILKDGSIIDQFDISKKGAYMFGRVDLCDFVLDHPTISRFHAVVQFKQSGEAYVYDLGSTHGTSVNKNQVKKKVYTELHVGDVIRFGHSSRLYIFQGPSELMPPEGDLKRVRTAKVREEMHDREASILRAKQEAALADGISWGMEEDAIEEAEIANMKKEIDAIRVKDISQGGLTQGQQTQIARNEQRTAQILEELESLEETLNESIQESIGARSGKVRSKKKGAPMEEEDEAPSDDDDFYDRTKKSATQKAGEHQSIETADSLLDKKDVIMKEMENKRSLISEKTKSINEIEGGADGGDALDTYMTGLSSQLVLDSTMQLQQDLSSLQSELDRILYLLKIADPTGEAAKKRDLNVKTSVLNEVEVATSGITKLLPREQNKKSGSGKLTDDSTRQEGTHEGTTQAVTVAEVENNVTDSTESKAPAYTVRKPQWLGAIHDSQKKEIKQEAAPSNVDDSDQFVNYKDRKEALGSTVSIQVESGIEAAAPGLIIRKRKLVEKPKESDDKATQLSASLVEAETAAADAVALLLKHQKGLLVSDEEGHDGAGAQTRNENTKSRRILGPEKPAFLGSNPDYEGWAPPKGQSGDGRTSLNERFGY
ncbi:hypothetical protein IFM89_003375 [Coptis chinensis]|uniref:FHA domain-containing protein n=1 Tax=Coptis chinensis TaxID=261450 RepID=A0A835IR54_9MAGN|nr:hypothetical protein IFM89_003375 [Coptis chinensis]